MAELNYCVAGHCFTILTEDKYKTEKLLPSYQDFASECGNEPLFEITVTTEAVGRMENRIAEFDIDGGKGLVCSGCDGYSFDIYDCATGMICRMVSDRSFRKASVSLPDLDSSTASFGLNNAVMIMFAFASSGHDTLLVHSSVVVKDAVAYLFLGRSGTGKSTHTRLWLNNIAGARLLNDDNPVLRVCGDRLLVYGSPWSGKTKCYINECVEVGGIVRLIQKPYNKIRKQGIAESYASLVSSCSVLREDACIYNNVINTVSTAVALAPFCVLECLPDADAALLAYKTLTSGN